MAKTNVEQDNQEVPDPKPPMIGFGWVFSLIVALVVAFLIFLVIVKAVLKPVVQDLSWEKPPLVSERLSQGLPVTEALREKGVTSIRVETLSEGRPTVSFRDGAPVDEQTFQRALDNSPGLPAFRDEDSVKAGFITIKSDQVIYKTPGPFSDAYGSLAPEYYDQARSAMSELLSRIEAFESRKARREERVEQWRQASDDPEAGKPD